MNFDKQNRMGVLCFGRRLVETLIEGPLAFQMHPRSRAEVPVGPQASVFSGGGSPNSLCFCCVLLFVQSTILYFCRFLRRKCPSFFECPARPHLLALACFWVFNTVMGSTLVWRSFSAFSHEVFPQSFIEPNGMWDS